MYLAPVENMIAHQAFGLPVPIMKLTREFEDWEYVWSTPYVSNVSNVPDPSNKWEDSISSILRACIHTPLLPTPGKEAYIDVWRFFCRIQSFGSAQRQGWLMEESHNDCLYGEDLQRVWSNFFRYVYNVSVLYYLSMEFYIPRNLFSVQDGELPYAEECEGEFPSLDLIFWSHNGYEEIPGWIRRHYHLALDRNIVFSEQNVIAPIRLDYVEDALFFMKRGDLPSSRWGHIFYKNMTKKRAVAAYLRVQKHIPGFKLSGSQLMTLNHPLTFHCLVEDKIPFAEVDAIHTSSASLFHVFWDNLAKSHRDWLNKQVPLTELVYLLQKWVEATTRGIIECKRLARLGDDLWIRWSQHVRIRRAFRLLRHDQSIHPDLLDVLKCLSYGNKHKSWFLLSWMRYRDVLCSNQ
jgi:hypothetical protein